MVVQPCTIQELQQAVAASDHIVVRGAGSKPALSSPDHDSLAVDLTQLSGVLEYEPGEFTFIYAGPLSIDKRAYIFQILWNAGGEASASNALAALKSVRIQ